MTIFERTKELAKKHGLSLSKLALEAGLSEKTLYRWRNNSPKLETVQAVAEVLNVSVDYLLGNTDDTEKNIVTVTKKTTDAELDKILDSTESYDGKALTDRDRETMKSLIRAYVQNKPE